MVFLPPLFPLNTTKTNPPLFQSSYLFNKARYPVDKCGGKLYCGYSLFTYKRFLVRFQENAQRMNV